MINLDGAGIAVVQNLQDQFGCVDFPSYTPFKSDIPIGIEIEVSWRSYFPDLWVDGFPNINSDLLQSISAECSIREKTLHPKLMQTVECGVKSGADKYWEFAFDPVFDTSITCNQVHILQQHNLIPPGPHSLHITVGGLPVSRSFCYLSMLLELYYSSEPRIMAGFHPTKDNLSHGWARKGFAGVFEKTGDNDIQHGYGIGAELRTLVLPASVVDLHKMLTTVQYVAECIQTNNSEWLVIQEQLVKCLRAFGLPDINWRKPHTNPAEWSMFAKNLYRMKEYMRDFVTATNLPMSPNQR